MRDSTADNMPDLEIRFFAPENGSHRVEMRLTGDLTPYDYPPGYLSVASLDKLFFGNLEKDGFNLFKVFTAEAKLHDAWTKARRDAPHCRIRLRFDAGTQKLQDLPWEQLFDGDLWLSENPGTPFSRYVADDKKTQPPLAELPLRVLCVIANPAALTRSPYKLAAIKEDLERENLRKSVLGVETVKLDFLEEVATQANIEHALQQGNYQVLHIIAHGAYISMLDESVLMLDDGNGQVDPVKTTELGRIFNNCAPLRAVVLASCYSASKEQDDLYSLGEKLVRLGIPAVVAMRGKLYMETARLFSRVLYEQLAQHGIIDVALNAARSAMHTRKVRDMMAPVLYMRLRDGKLWQVPAAQSSQPAAPPVSPVLKDVSWPAYADKLRAILRQVPAMNDYGNRTALTRGLPDGPVGYIQRSTAKLSDLRNLVDGAEGMGLLGNGKHALVVMSKNVLEFVEGISLEADVKALLASVGE